MGRIIVFLTFSLFFINCSSAFTVYKNLNKDITIKSNHYYEEKKIIKPIINNENQECILIIKWYNTANSKIKRFHALLYSYENEKINFIENTNESPYEFKIRNQIEDYSDRNLNFILQKYLSGEEEYLLNILSPYSGPQYPYYLYDFKEQKKIKIQEFVLSDDRTRVKELFEDDGW